jgi:hypothetical protein
MPILELLSAAKAEILFREKRKLTEREFIEWLIATPESRARWNLYSREQAFHRLKHLRAVKKRNGAA